MIHVNGQARLDGILIEKSLRITGTGAITENVLQVFGSVRILDQHAHIAAITTLVNATGVYADAYDGTNTEILTLDGAVLSGCLVGSMFLKDQDETQIYSVLDSSQVRVNELTDVKKAGKPFTITQKNGADTFIRLHLTTTDAPIDFTIEMCFLFERLDIGSNLVFL